MSMTVFQTDISTQIIDVGQYSAGAIEISKNLLADCTGDYFLFSIDSFHSMLVLGSADTYTFIGDTLYMDFPADTDFYIIEATFITHTVSVSESGTISGSSSGNFYGFQNSGSFSGGFSGDYIGSFDLEVNDPVNYQLFYYVDSDGFEVQLQNNQLCFSSVEGYPHLQEGVYYLAYYQIAIITCVCFFALFARIFKHVRQ